MNVTGVKSLEHLTLAQETIERKLQQQVDNVQIDNTFYSQALKWLQNDPEGL